MGLGGVSCAGPADRVVVGPVVTMPASRPQVRGLAVAGGKIVFVGDAASARKLLRSGGRLIALEKIAAYSKKHPELEWVIGSGWSGDWDWVNRGLGPSAAELDAVVA